MARLIEGRPRAQARGGDVSEDANALVKRTRLEMQSAVGSRRARLPEAFPRWQQQRDDAARTAAASRRGARGVIALLLPPRESFRQSRAPRSDGEIGRASCRERV